MSMQLKERAFNWVRGEWLRKTTQATEAMITRLVIDAPSINGTGASMGSALINTYLKSMTVSVMNL